jgi:hypothetical protein
LTDTETTTASHGHSDGELQLEMFRIIEERLSAALSREEDVDYRGLKATRRTQVIGRAALAMVILLTPPVFYLIWTLVGAMGVITDRMGMMNADISQMRQRFSGVSVRMQRINGAVSSMTENVAVIVPMEHRLLSMRDDMRLLSGSMGRIAPNVAQIDRILGGMDQNLIQIDYTFGFLNRDVYRMRRDVNQMSSPMRMMPFFGQ